MVHMETTQRSSQSFCARPGCGIAKSLHGHSGAACSNFIQPGSKEANEAKRTHLSVVPECEHSPTGKHSFSPDIEYDESGKTINCEHCGEYPEEETVETPTLSDADLMAEWKARAAALGVLA